MWTRQRTRKNEGSTMKLKPLIVGIERMDRLIDRAVYRLYGLSEGDGSGEDL